MHNIPTAGKSVTNSAIKTTEIQFKRSFSSPQSHLPHRLSLRVDEISVDLYLTREFSPRSLVSSLVKNRYKPRSQDALHDSAVRRNNWIGNSVKTTLKIIDRAFFSYLSRQKDVDIFLDNTRNKFVGFQLRGWVRSFLLLSLRNIVNWSYWLTVAKIKKKCDCVETCQISEIFDKRQN